MARRSVLLILVFAVGVSNFHGFETGNSLYPKIQALKLYHSDIESHYIRPPGEVGIYLDAMEAHGYIIGVFDSFDGIFFDSPSGITIGQVLDVAIKYVEEHPEERHLGAPDLLTKAWIAAWPNK